MTNTELKKKISELIQHSVSAYKIVIDIDSEWDKDESHYIHANVWYADRWSNQEFKDFFIKDCKTIEEAREKVMDVSDYLEEYFDYVKPEI